MNLETARCFVLPIVYDGDDKLAPLGTWLARLPLEMSRIIFSNIRTGVSQKRT